MKVIIAGGRNITDRTIVAKAIKGAPFKITEVVSGKAKGVDAIGETYARALGLHVKAFPADWDQYGKGAGPIRNRQMAQYADALIAVWDGFSRGTGNMIAEMRKLGKPVHIYRIEE